MGGSLVRRMPKSNLSSVEKIPGSKVKFQEKLTKQPKGRMQENNRSRALRCCAKNLTFNWPTYLRKLEPQWVKLKHARGYRD